MTKMNRGPLLPRHGVRSFVPAGLALPGRANGASRRSRHARRVEPVGLGRSPRTLLRPVRNPPPLAPRSRETAMDALAPSVGPTGAGDGHCLNGPSPGQREPDLGTAPEDRKPANQTVLTIEADPRRRQSAPKSCAVEYPTYTTKYSSPIWVMPGPGPPSALRNCRQSGEDRGPGRSPSR
jgi:hypothetical protein